MNKSRSWVVEFGLIFIITVLGMTSSQMSHIQQEAPRTATIQVVDGKEKGRTRGKRGRATDSQTDR